MHFAVAVFSDDTKTLDQLLEPYQENNMGTVCDDYLEFFNVEDEYRKKYETESTTMVKLSNGTIEYPWSESAKKDADAEKIELHFKDIYATFEEFMEGYGDYEKDEITGKYGYWENPNAKWDWWEIGGRYSYSYRKVDGKVKDYDFSPDEEDYKEAIRIWEIVVEGQPLKEGEEMPFINNPKYYTNKFNDKETFAKLSANFVTYAVITPDGEWHQNGVGYVPTGEENIDWNVNYKARFIDTADPEWYLTIVDSHI